MTIKEISLRFSLSQDTLRYYERIGLIPPVNRNKSGMRDYNEEDCRWIEFIKCMRKAGLPIEALIEYVSLFNDGDTSLEARKEILIDQREQLMLRIEEMQQTLNRLDGKIKNYEQKMVACEKSLKRLPK